MAVGLRGGLRILWGVTLSDKSARTMEGLWLVRLRGLGADPQLDSVPPESVPGEEGGVVGT